MSDDVNAAVEAFNAHVDQLEEDHGVELDAAERQRIFGQSVASGFSPESTQQAFGELVESEYDDEDFDDDDDDEFDLEEEEDDGVPDQLAADVDLQLGKLERQLGRDLTDREIANVSKTAHLQMRSGARVDLEGALNDYQAQFETQQSRSEFFARRMEDSRPEPEGRDEYDLTTNEGRSAYYDARLNGGMDADDFEDAPGEAA
jgi:hypothetical protein